MKKRATTTSIPTALCLLASLLLTATSALAQSVVATISVGTKPVAVAVNSVTDKIYVANFGTRPLGGMISCGVPGSVSVIDGVTNSVGTVTISNPITLFYSVGAGLPVGTVLVLGRSHPTAL